MNEQIQVPKIIDQQSEKKDIQINLKNKTRVARKNPTVRKKSIPNINPQQQQQNIPANQKQRKTLPPKNTFIYRNIDDSWLNKYFIYRHESLNRYLTLTDFKNNLDNLPKIIK